MFLQYEKAQELVTLLDSTLSRVVHEHRSVQDAYDWDIRNKIVKAVNRELGFDALVGNYQADEATFYISKAIFGG